jgi:hypothetical protein
VADHFIVIGSAAEHALLEALYRRDVVGIMIGARREGPAGTIGIMP